MFDFSDDESFFMLAAVIAMIAFAASYFRPLMNVYAPRLPMPGRWTLSIWPIACIVPTLIVLQRWADPQVIGHFDYELLFLTGALAWVLAAAWALPLLGMSIRDDVLARANVASAAAAMAWMVAVGIVYAAANIGAGPTIWTTLAPAGMGTVALMLLMMTSGAAEAITVGRDKTAAMLFSAEALILAGVLGYAVAGDWVSWPETWASFSRRGWPAAVVAAVFGVANRLRSRS